MEMTTGVVYIPDWMPGLCRHLCRTHREITQHKNRAALTNAHPERSAVAENAIDTGHTINWRNTQVKAGILPHVYDALIHENTRPPMRAQNNQQP